MRPLLVTADLLRRMRACYPSIEKFEKLWPEGCLLTVENVRLVRYQWLSTDWFCRHYVRGEPAILRWYTEQMDRAWNKRSEVLKRSWARTYELSVKTGKQLSARVAQAKHDRLMKELNRAYDAAQDRAIVMAVNRFRRRNRS